MFLRRCDIVLNASDDLSIKLYLIPLDKFDRSVFEEKKIFEWKKLS